MTFDLTEQEANLIGQALAAQPYNVVAALIAKLQQQAREQQVASEVPKAEPAPSEG